MTDIKDSRLNLKVCEGCGALWLRSTTLTTVYCRRCAARLAAFPPPRGKRGGGRRPKLARVLHHARVQHHTHAAEMVRTNSSSAQASCAAGGAR